MKESGRRGLQISELVRRVLSTYMQENSLMDEDNRAVNMTITQVSLSKDLRWADVFVAPLYGSSHDGDAMLRVLKRYHKALRYYLAQSAQLKRTPDLRFIYDESFDRAMRMEQLIDKA